MVKVTDYVNEDIRLGRLNREDAIEIVSKFDGSCANYYIESFCQYIEISVDEFWNVVRKNVNRELFEITRNGQILPKFYVGLGL